jgi:hypothetical protein
LAPAIHKGWRYTENVPEAMYRHALCVARMTVPVPDESWLPIAMSATTDYYVGDMR